MKVVVEGLLPVDPSSAWHTLLDWERQPEWIVDAVWVRVVSAHREGTGVLIASKTRVLGIPLLTDHLEVTEWDPPRRLVIARRGFVRGRGLWLLEPAASGTRFVWEEEIRVPIPLLGELALLAYRPLMRRLMRRSLRNLATRLR